MTWREGRGEWGYVEDGFRGGEHGLRGGAHGLRGGAHGSRGGRVSWRWVTAQTGYGDAQLS